MKVDDRKLPPSDAQAHPKRSFDSLLRQAARGPKTNAPKKPVPAGPAPGSGKLPTKQTPAIERPALPPGSRPAVPLQTVLQSTEVAQRKLADARGTDALLVTGRERSERFDSVLALAHGETRTHHETHPSVQLRDRLFEALERQINPPEPELARPNSETLQLDAAGQQVAAAERVHAPAAVRETARSEAVMAMVQKIELVLRSHSPALSLELCGSAAAQLEVTRTGPKEVSIELRARGASERRELEKSTESLREALASRGVQVKTIRIV